LSRALRAGVSCAPEAAPRGVGCCPARWNLRRSRALRRKLLARRKPEAALWKLRRKPEAALWKQRRKPEAAPRGGSRKRRRLCVLGGLAR
jgi:hypothetical protein